MLAYLVAGILFCVGINLLYKIIIKAIKAMSIKEILIVLFLLLIVFIISFGKYILAILWLVLGPLILG